MKYLIYLFPILVIISGCRDEICGDSSCIIDAPCSDGNCIDLKDTIRTWGSIQYRHINNSKYAFSINPNNTSMIAYFQQKGTGTMDSITLIVENLETNSKIEVASNRFFDEYTKPAWDKDNNLYFNNNGPIMMYDMNSGNIIFPDFSNLSGIIVSIDGTRLISQSAEETSIINLLTDNITTVGTSTDRLPISSPSQSHIAYFDGTKDSIFVLNTNTDITTGLFKFEHQPLSFAWGSEQDLYWTSFSGLFKVNIETRQVERIKKHCGTGTKVKYLNPFFDADGKFYVTREEGKQVGLIDVSLNGKIIEYDLNACTEIDIFE